MSQLVPHCQDLPLAFFLPHLRDALPQSGQPSESAVVIEGVRPG
jgi:hypothetical protein